MKFKNEIRFWLLAGGITLLISLAVLLAMLNRDYAQPGDSFRLEAAKLLLQFLLVGVGGALVLAYLNHRRDRAEKEAAKKAADRERLAVRRAALQELIRQIGDADRRLKLVKRQLRAAIARDEPDPKNPPVRPYNVPTASFEKAMEALLTAQVSAEEVRDRVAVSIELLDRPQIDRVRAALHYAARYFHDVYEDYEHCRIKRRGDHFLITPACNNIHNFLFARDLPADLPRGHVKNLRAEFAAMQERCGELKPRHEALMRIEELRQQDSKRKRRYRAITAECFSLAADELRVEVWRTCPVEAAAAGATAPH